MNKLVSEEVAEEMLGVLPPAVWYRNNEIEVFQVGEAVDYVGGQATFDTYQRAMKGDDRNWYFKGNIHLIKMDKKFLLMSNPDCL